MDILADPVYRTFTKIAEQSQVPTYVLSAEPVEKTAADDLEDGMFADDGSRLYPIHDKAHVWLAASYLKEAEDETPPDFYKYAKSRIERAATIYGIEDDVKEVFAKQAEVYTPEDDDSNYGWLRKDAEGTVIERRYPMFDMYGVEKAASYFMSNRFKYPVETRREIAGSIFSKSRQHGVTVPPTLQKEAGLGLPVRDTLVEELKVRASLTKDAEAKQAFEAIAAVVEVASQDELLKSAFDLEANIDALDELNGMRRHYNVRLMSPAETVYAMSMKQAEDFVDDSLPLNKHVFSVTKLASLDPHVFGVLGDDLVSELSTEDGKVDREKLASIIPTLPTPDKILLEDHLANLFA